MHPWIADIPCIRYPHLRTFTITYPGNRQTQSSEVLERIITVQNAVEIAASYPAGVIGDTAENLEASAAGENLEWTKLYKEAEEVARKEGFEEIAIQFKEIAEVEEEHEKRYRKLLKNVKEGKVFKKDSVVKWKCRNCGYVHEGKEAPGECPACAHPQSYYELLCENY